MEKINIVRNDTNTDSWSALLKGLRDFMEKNGIKEDPRYTYEDEGENNFILWLKEDKATKVKEYLAIAGVKIKEENLETLNK